MLKRWIAAPAAVALLAAGPLVAGPFEEALAAYQSGEGTVAEALWRPLAERGDTAAQFNIGVLYEHGRGVPADLEEAAKWYRRAAEAGDLLAQTKLGALYADGRGVAQDLETAAQWYSRAAEKDHPSAQYALGTLYANGRGVPRNISMASDLYEQADSNSCTTDMVSAADGIRTRSTLDPAGG